MVRDFEFKIQDSKFKIQRGAMNRIHAIRIFIINHWQSHTKYRNKRFFSQIPPTYRFFT